MSFGLLLAILPLLAQEPAPTSVEASIEVIELLIENQAEDYEVGQALMALARLDDPEAAESIAELLDDFSGQLREAGIIALGNCQQENRFELLGNIVEKSRQLPDRLAAARTLIKTDEGRSWLIKRFKKLKDSQVQALLISSLTGGKDDERLLSTALKSKNPEVRGRALRKAAELNFPAGHKAALKGLKDANLAVKRAAAISCGEYGGLDAFEALAKESEGAKGPELRAGLLRGMKLASTQDEVAALTKSMRKFRKPEAKGLMAQALIVAGAHQPALAGPAFAELLEEEDAGLRQLAIRGIEATSFEPALEALILLLEHEDVLVRADAVRAIGSFSRVPEQYGKQIVALANSPETSVRLNATLALRALDTKQSLPALDRALQDNNWAIQDVAIEILNDMRTIPAVRLLAEHMQRATGLMRYETYERLKLLTGQDFGPAKGSWEAWMRDYGDDLELPSEAEAQKMLAELAARRAQNDQGYGKAEYHGLVVRPGGTLFILDGSGSMGFNYTSDAQLFHTFFVNELCATIDNLTGDHQFNIIDFSGSARSWKPKLVIADDANKKEAIQHLKNLRPWGGTNLSASLQKAFDMKDVQQVYLMTDGDPTQGITLKSAIVDWVVEMNRTRRIRFHTIVAGDVDGSFLAEIAQLNRGTNGDLRPSFTPDEKEDKAK
ncbi:MAG: VWA domain-containing protein [Planctomycetes bacterium]|nr:VWA domain-containing protein [Planctomycetota bacterium]